MLKPALRALRHCLGLGEDSLTLLEAPAGQRHIDVVLLGVSGDVVAVELKLGDWKRALSQASLNQLWADLSYIVIPQSRESAISACEVARSYGVGVVEVGVDTASVRVVAVASRLVDPSRRSRLLELVASGS
jgi:hypothetical protein